MSSAFVCWGQKRRIREADFDQWLIRFTLTASNLSEVETQNSVTLY